jgi:hypothetical protein
VQAPSATLAARGANERRRLHYRLAALMKHELRMQAVILLNLDWGALRRRFKHVEGLGFDLASTGDHFCDWSNPPSPLLEMRTVLAGIAQGTERIRIAPCVGQIPLRNPAMFARRALTVDHISGGRLEVGLGLGLPMDLSYEMIGMENWSSPKRVGHFTEYVEIVDQMLSQEITTDTADHCRCLGADHGEEGRRPRRHLEHHELRRNIRRATCRDVYPHRCGVGALRQDRSRSFDASDLVQHVRSRLSLERRKYQLLRVP